MSDLIGWRGSPWRGEEEREGRPISLFFGSLQSGSRGEPLPPRLGTHTLIYIDALERGEGRDVGALRSRR